MGCTTMLVGRKASLNGATLIARNDDSPSGVFVAKKWVVVSPEDQPKHYKAVRSKLELDLPKNPLRYTATPNAREGEGFWGASGINSSNVAMTATETTTSNPRVYAGDPLLDPKTEGGIGEEDILLLVLPYIHSAKEGVLRLGELLETYGTYERNGIAFSDSKDIWWLETIGGHHWMAYRLPEDCYAVLPNEFCLDRFDFKDAFGKAKDYLCSKDLREFIINNDLGDPEHFNPRESFGSHRDADHVYNTPRAYFLQRLFSPKAVEEKKLTPASEDWEFCLKPERLLIPEDVKYALSYHYQGTPHDPYVKGNEAIYRPIGISRTDDMSILELKEEARPIEWVSLGCNVYSPSCPFFADVSQTPEYLHNAVNRVDTENFYWAIRVISGLADSHFNLVSPYIDRYQESVSSKGRALIKEAIKEGRSSELTNQRIADMLRKETDECLFLVLLAVSKVMKNGFSRSDD